MTSGVASTIGLPTLRTMAFELLPLAVRGDLFLIVGQELSVILSMFEVTNFDRLLLPVDRIRKVTSAAYAAASARSPWALTSPTNSQPRRASFMAAPGGEISCPRFR